MLFNVSVSLCQAALDYQSVKLLCNYNWCESVIPRTSWEATVSVVIKWISAVLFVPLIIWWQLCHHKWDFLWIKQCRQLHASKVEQKCAFTVTGLIVHCVRSRHGTAIYLLVALIVHLSQRPEQLVSTQSKTFAFEIMHILLNKVLSASSSLGALIAINCFLFSWPII